MANSVEFSLAEALKKYMQHTFETIMLKEIEAKEEYLRGVKDQLQKDLDIFIVEQKKEIRKQAQRMAVELLHKQNYAGVAIEFKL